MNLGVLVSTQSSMVWAFTTNPLMENYRITSNRMVHVALSPKDESSPNPNNASASTNETRAGGFVQGFKNFFAELDAFVDDATARRLGNGAAFYGKRKSNFYGENDKMKKMDRDLFDMTEDYAGPSTAGYFKWMPDEEGRMPLCEFVGLYD